MLKQIGFAISCVMASCAIASPASAPLPVYTVAAAEGKAVEPQTDTWLLHLPGISGRRWVDDQLALGFRDAGFAGVLQMYDWTGNAPGISALRAYKHNQDEAQKVADFIVDHLRKQPSLHIILTGHSGGTGIIVWALERLPDDMKVDKVILLASALSPEYDLRKALAHVRGACISFCSENDIVVLGTGTRMFGTMDGKKTDAAGEKGFVLPKDADAKQYDKLIQKPYDKSWMQYHNLGDHIGCMRRDFIEKVVAPLAAIEQKPTAGQIESQRASKSSK